MEEAAAVLRAPAATALLAAVLRASAATLRYWRHLGVGPDGFRLGRRVVCRREDVDRWAAYGGRPSHEFHSLGRLSTTEVARRLQFSECTVQGHLKAIFAKVGVRRRRDLIAQIFFEHYGLRLGSWATIGSAGWFLDPRS